MKAITLRNLSIPLLVLLGFVYLAFSPMSPRTSAQENPEVKEQVKTHRVRSLMKFDPSSRSADGSALGTESIVSPEAATIGTNVNASNQAGPQSETDIAIDPTNANHIIAGSNDISSGSMRVYESFNGGASFTNTALPDAPAPFNAFASDPAVTFD